MYTTCTSRHAGTSIMPPSNIVFLFGIRGQTRVECIDGAVSLALLLAVSSDLLQVRRDKQVANMWVHVGHAIKFDSTMLGVFSLSEALLSYTCLKSA